MFTVHFQGAQPFKVNPRASRLVPVAASFSSAPYREPADWPLRYRRAELLKEIRE